MLFWIHFCLFINIWSEIYKHCHFFCFLILYLYVSAQLWLDSFRVYFSQLEEQTVHFEFLWFLSCVTDVGHASYIVTISMSTTKCFFLTFLHATKHKKKSCQMHECLELWHFWKKQQLKIITCMRLESKWYITLQHFHIIATSRPLGFMWNTFHTWVASLYVREGVDPRLICSLAAKRERKS